MNRLHSSLALLLAVALGFLASGEMPNLFIAGLGAALLVIALWRQIEILAAFGFILLVLAAALNARQEGQALLALSSLCASLAAWDVVSYGLLLRCTGVPLNKRLFQRRLWRLAIVLVCGWGLGGLALWLELSLSFGVLLGLGLFVAVSLSISVMYLRRRDEVAR